MIGGYSGAAFGIQHMSTAAIQWGPITYGENARHDPKPPILLEDPKNIPQRLALKQGAGVRAKLARIVSSTNPPGSIQRTGRT